MTYVLAGFSGLLIVVVALLGVALYRLQVSHLNHLTHFILESRKERDLLLATAYQERERLFAEAREERRALADRIQHPEIRQVVAAPVADAEPPKDAAEYAQVGGIVPDGAHVGTQEGDEFPPFELTMPDMLEHVGSVLDG